MIDVLGSISALVIKTAILLDPFFVLSVFAAMTENYTQARRRKMAIRCMLAIGGICILVYFLGDLIFSSLGITLDAFRIGAGVVLFLSGLEIVRGTPVIRNISEETMAHEDISVVPIAIPYTVGPGTIGALITLSNGITSPIGYVIDIIGISIAVLILGTMLFFVSAIERLLKKKGITILSKLTGLFLVALATQIIVQGIKGFFQ